MIKSLSISNFAIIDYVEVNFHKGMTTITGETGAGKSIILGALSLVLGKRADLSILKDSSKKCIVEATFDISKYNLKTFFDVENIDYLDETILRRELIPTGKSRAFINDTPVNLQILNVISSNLIDINNQNETHTFFNKSFQFKFLDSLSDTIDNSSQFRSKYREMKTLITSNEKLIKIYDTGIRDHDYQKFLYEELVSLDLNKDSLNKLEDEVNELSNVYDLKSKLSFCVNSIDSDENGILTRLGEVLTNLSSSETFSNNVSTYYSRINSLYIELKDVVNDIEIYKESLEYNPESISSKIIVGRLHFLDIINLIESKILDSSPPEIIFLIGLNSDPKFEENNNSNFAFPYSLSSSIGNKLILNFAFFIPNLDRIEFNCFCISGIALNLFSLIFSDNFKRNSFF